MEPFYRRRSYQVLAVMAFLLAFALVWHWIGNRNAMPAMNPENVVADVAGETISYLQFQSAVNRQLMKNYNAQGVIRASDIEYVKIGVFRALVNDAMLKILSRKNNVVVTDEDIQVRVRKLRKQLKDPRVFDMLMQSSGYRTTEEFYDDLRLQITESKLAEKRYPNLTVSRKEVTETLPTIRLRQIFFRIDPKRLKAVEINDAVKQVRDRAEMVRAMLVASGGRNFNELAKKYTMEAAQIKGGELGWISKSAVEPDYWKNVKDLKPNEITPVFETGAGFHIVQCVGRRDPDDKTWGKLTDIAMKVARLRKRQTLFKAWFNSRLREVDEGGRIKVYDPMLLGHRLREQGRLDEAIKSFEEAARREPDNPYYLVDIGDIYTKMGKPTEGLKYFSRAIEINPSDGSLHFRLGEAYMYYGDLNMAVQEFRRASDMTRLDYEMHRRLGMVYTQLGMLKETDVEQERYIRAIELQSSRAAALTGEQPSPATGTAAPQPANPGVPGAAPQPGLSLPGTP